MSNFKICVFGCWNKGCKVNTGQRRVSELIKSKESKYKFMVILGDNYYAEKLTLGNGLKVKDTNINELLDGFKCLENINLEKKLIMGNHDIVDSLDKSCSALKIQLKQPTYDVKFPFGYDLYYLYQKENEYETVLFIYLDTSLYDESLNDTNSCFKSSLNVDIGVLKEEQDTFIKQTLEMTNNKTYNIENVVFFAHEPLITFKNKIKDKKNVNSGSFNKSLLELLFDQKNKYKDKNFYWICADYHIYQNSIITHNEFPECVINQWIFGTGGGELDTPPTINTYTVNIPTVNIPTVNTPTVNQYKLEILPNVIYDSNGNDISTLFNTYGIAKHGYGEIIFDFNSVTHKFISIDNDITGGLNDNYKSKYLKYKSKYNELKKLKNV